MDKKKRLQKKDLKLALRFQKKFNKIIITKDKDTGFYSLFFKCDSEAILKLRTKITDAEIQEEVENGTT